MAGDAVVGALRVVLGMDTASFEDGAKKAAKSASNFGQQLLAVFGGVTLAGAVESLFDKLSHSFKEGITKSLEFADQMGKMAQKVGVPVEELTKLKLAADLSDVSMESLSKSLGVLSKNMLDAVKGTGQARQQFQDLGVSVTDSAGNLRPVTGVLADISDKFSGASDGAVKTATALNLLGKGGKDLIPLLNQGSEEIKHLADMAERMGLVISRDTAAQSEKFNDNLKILHKTTEGFANLVVAGLLPALVRWSDQAVDTATHTDLVRQSADQVVTAVKNVVAWFAFETTAAIETFKAIGELYDALKSLPSSLDEASKHLQAANKINEEAPAKAEAAAQAWRDMFNKLTVTVRNTKNELSIGETPLGKELDKLALQSDILRGKFNDLPTGFAQLAVNMKLTDEAGKNLGTTIDQLSAEQLKLAQGIAGVQVAQAAVDLQSPYEKYLITLQQIQVQQALVAGSAELSAQRQAVAAAKLQGVYANAAASIVGSLGDSVQAFAGDSKRLVAVAQAIHAAQALIAAYAGAAEALATGVFPANLVASAAVLAKGLAFVAAIKTVGFAQGGSFKIGGSGGIDSQLVSFKATPGEMVDIRRPGQERTSDTRGPTEIVVRGMRPDDLFNTRWLRALVDTLNAGHKDGYRLQFGD